MSDVSNYRVVVVDEKIWTEWEGGKFSVPDVTDASEVSVPEAKGIGAHRPWDEVVVHDPNRGGPRRR